MATSSVKLSNQQIEELRQYFPADSFVQPPQYALYQIRYDECVITAYTSGKVVFQGKNAGIYGAKYLLQDQVDPYPQCGSDEVGTGDYFGPVVVCACALDDSHTELVERLGIKDSKECSDERIRMIAPEILEKVPYSLLILKNSKYNEVHQSNNMNEIKAKLHNQCYRLLQKKLGSLPKLRVVDQFAPEKTYYSYLKNEPEVIGGITFLTKAENQFPSVACASILARYAFLTTWDEMEKTYDMVLHKGAGSLVDEDVVEFAKRYGKNRLKEVAKVHFKNTKKAL